MALQRIPLLGNALPRSEGDGEGINLAEYWRIVRRHKAGIIGLTLVGALVGGLKVMSEVPIYQASLTMLLEPEAPKIISLQQMQMQTSPWLFYETQYEIIRSRAIAERVVEKLGLDRMPDAASAPKSGTGTLDVSELVDGVMQMVGLSNPPAAAPAAALPPTPEQKQDRLASLAGSIQGSLGVRGGERSQLVVISYDSADPKFAAAAANAVAEAYMEMGMESRLNTAKQAGLWLNERLDDLRKKLAESEAALQAFQSREKMIDTKSREEITSTKLSTLNKEAMEAQLKFADLAKRYGERHPKIVAAKAELDAATARLSAASGAVVETKGKEFELAKLEREVATNRQLYETFLTRFKETDTAGDYNIRNVRILDRAQIPGAPYKPNKKRVVGMYLGFGLFFGILLAFVREHLDNTFKTPLDVEDKLKLPVLGIMPLLGKSGKGKAQAERHFIAEPRSPFAESVNHIRTGVLFSNIDNPPKTVLVTSAMQGEGKTTLSSNLALSFSQLGPTLLIDADLRKPRVASIAGLDKESGLVDLVGGQRNFQDVVVRDRDAKNLFIMKSGTIPPNPLELLSSKKFAHLLEELKQRFSHIVVDTAPVLPVSDAIVLGHIVDGVIVVVRADKTPHAMAQDAVRRLQAANVMPLGVALSQVSARRMSYHYYDSYYYGAYYGYGEKEKKKASA